MVVSLSDPASAYRSNKNTALLKIVSVWMISDHLKLDEWQLIRREDAMLGAPPTDDYYCGTANGLSAFVFRTQNGPMRVREPSLMSTRV